MKPQIARATEVMTIGAIAAEAVVGFKGDGTKSDGTGMVAMV